MYQRINYTEDAKRRFPEKKRDSSGIAENLRNREKKGGQTPGQSEREKNTREEEERGNTGTREGGTEKETYNNF